MKPQLDRPCTAFVGSKKISSGSVLEVAADVKALLQKKSDISVLIFDDLTSLPVEIDFRGSLETVLKKLESLSSEATPEKNAGPGRPKLGVVSREIGLLPHHWEWLALQSGGASVTLRKLVEEAKKKNSGKDQIRQAQDATYKFMMAMTGDLPQLEEALRALFAKDRKTFQSFMKEWPKDLVSHIQKISKSAFQ